MASTGGRMEGNRSAPTTTDAAVRPVSPLTGPPAAPSLNEQRPSAWLALLAEGGYGTFVGTVALLHLVRPDLDPATRTISEYAVGPSGFVMGGAFLALGGGTLSLAAALARGDTPNPTGGLGLALLAAFSLGAALCAIFPTDLTTPGMAVTMTGRVHNVAAVVALGAGFGMMLVSGRCFRRTAGWRARSGPTLAAALLAVATLLVLGRAAGFGWAERGFVGIIVIWHWVYAHRVRQLTAAR